MLLVKELCVFYEDYPSFAKVCKSWHSAALQAVKDNSPPSCLPSLMLSEKAGDEEFRELVLLSNKTIRKIRLPEAYGKLCMSSYGWLVTVANDHSSQLINPLSHEIFNLPKIENSLEWCNCINKLLFLAESWLVVVAWGSGELGFCRIEDNKWTTSDDRDWNAMIMDITYYNGRVYTLDYSCYIRAWDVCGEDPNQSVDVTRMPADVDWGLGRAYILALDDGQKKRLLVVIRKGFTGFTVHNGYYETKHFRVWGYDLGTGTWARVKDLGTKSLFVGHNSSFWVKEDTTRMITGNCIYFTDDGISKFDSRTKNGGGDMGVYHLSDGTIDHQFTGESINNLTPPIWLQSM